MADKFHLYVKSTLDYHIVQTANSYTLPVVDLDSAAMVTELLDSDATAVVWAFGSWSESPRDPLWYLDFELGVKTSHDPAQYTSLDVTGLLSSTFPVNSAIPVFDYTGDTPSTAQQGEILITGITASPSQPDRLSGIRMLSVQARVIRRI